MNANIPPPPGRTRARERPSPRLGSGRQIDYNVRVSRDTAALHASALRLIVADLEAGAIARGREVGRKCVYRLELCAASLEAAVARDEALLEWLGPEGERIVLKCLAWQRRMERDEAAFCEAEETLMSVETAAELEAAADGTPTRDDFRALQAFEAAARFAPAELPTGEPVGAPAHDVREWPTFPKWITGEPVKEPGLDGLLDLLPNEQPPL